MDNSLTLINLPWHEVLFENILCFLNMKDLFILRSLSRNYKMLVENYFEVCQNINLSIHQKFNKDAFHILSICCQRIKKLNISWCNWLTDDMLADFLLNNPNLVEINMRFCKSIGAKSMQTLIIKCTNLKCLLMTSCLWLTVGAVESLIYHQQNLETVDFCECLALSERCIMKFVVKFSLIKNLSLAYIPSVTDNTLIVIADHCSNLENLNIVGCEVSLDAIRNVFTNCNKLNTLQMTGGMLIRESLIRRYE